MKPILGYFKLRGWAGPIRLLLAYLEVDYTETFFQLPVPTRKSFDDNFDAQSNNRQNNENLPDWEKEKESSNLQFPNLPYWIDGNMMLTETKAILRHIARTIFPKLLGMTADEMAQVDMLTEVFWDMWNALCQICRESDDSAKEEFLDMTKKKLLLLSKMFVTEWISGSHITIADFLLYELLYHLKLFSGTLLDNYPKLEEFMKRFQSIPQIRKYFLSEESIKGPCFSDKFKSKL